MAVRVFPGLPVGHSVEDSAQADAQRAQADARRAQADAQRAQMEAQAEARQAQIEAQQAQAEAQADAQRAQADARRARSPGWSPGKWLNPTIVLLALLVLLLWRRGRGERPPAQA
jgi:multidrug efflux pump subunit AcrA (membrane-fusion protein)